MSKFSWCMLSYAPSITSMPEVYQRFLKLIHTPQVYPDWYLLSRETAVVESILRGTNAKPIMGSRQPKTLDLKLTEIFFAGWLKKKLVTLNPQTNVYLVGRTYEVQ